MDHAALEKPIEKRTPWMAGITNSVPMLAVLSTPQRTTVMATSVPVCPQRRVTAATQTRVMPCPVPCASVRHRRP